MSLAAAVHSAVALARPGALSRRQRAGTVVCQANNTQQKKGALGLGDVLGPIGLTVGKDIKLEEAQPEAPAAPSAAAPAAAAPKKSKKGQQGGAAQQVNRMMDFAGVSLGPIGLTVGSDLQKPSFDEEDGAGPSGTDGSGRPDSYASLSTEEWRQLYEKDGRVDLWVKEEFNSGSRLVGGSAVHRGGVAGYLSGEGPGLETAAVHKVKIKNNNTGEELEVEVPEDRYVLFAAEEQGLDLPYACRLGCCTSCTVKVLEGQMFQPHSLGLSKALRDKGYALMCVGYPVTDCVLETVSEDEAYELQFGAAFQEGATDPNSPQVERDDFAIELAMLDE